jgi:hypothetical protein
MLAESLPNAPTLLSIDLHSVENALLPFRHFLRKAGIRIFGIMLKPRYIVGTEPLDQ